MSKNRSRLLHPGEVSLVNNASNDGDDGSRWKDGLNVALISGFLVIGTIALTLLLLLYPESKSSEEYGVVFDAGSTHTALYVYKWPEDKRLGGTAVPVDEVYFHETTPGISSFADKQHHPNEAGASLNGLIKEALNAVPQDKRSSSPVYLGATAGMRLVEEVNHTTSTQIMSSVRKVLSESGFQFASGNAEIISGEDEGSLGWITVNYLKNVLQADKHKPSAGALDMGGASTEISFVAENGSNATEHFQLYGEEYPVYTKTYLCYGLNEIYRRFLAELAKNSDNATNIPNPCVHKEFNVTKNATYLWDAPCSCQPSSPVRDSFTFYGSMNLSECTRQVARLFAFNNTCPGNPNVFSRGNQPTLAGNFLAFSGYYFLAKALSLTSSPTMKEFRSGYERICNKTMGKRKDFLATDIPACFGGQYVYALLTQGYGFDNRTWNISFLNKVENKSLGWTLGYMINATNLIPRSKPKSKRLHDEILIPALIVSGLFIVIGLLLCGKFIRRKKRDQSGYSEI